MLNHLERILVTMVTLINLWVYCYITNLTFPCIRRRQVERRASGWTGRLIGNISHFRYSDVCEIRIIYGLKMPNRGFLESADWLFTDQSINKAVRHWTHFFCIMSAISISWLSLLPLLYLILCLGKDGRSRCSFFKSK